MDHENYCESCVNLIRAERLKGTPLRLRSELKGTLSQEKRVPLKETISQEKSALRALIFRDKGQTRFFIERCIFFFINHNILTHDEKKIQPAGGGFLDNFSRDSVPLT